MRGGMPSFFDFEVMVRNSCSVTDCFSGNDCFLSANNLCEPVSVLDSTIPSGTTSSSTLSSSLGGGAVSTDTAGFATVVSDGNPSPKWQQDSTTATSSSAGGLDSELLPVPQSLEVAALGGGGRVCGEKCAMEDWECVLSGSSAASLGHEQSIFGWIMGDVEDPAINGFRSKFLQFSSGGAASEIDLGGGFGVMDQAFGGENFGVNFVSRFSSNNRSNCEKIDSSNLIKIHQDSQNIMSPSSVTADGLEAIPFHRQAAYDYSTEFKPPILNPQLLLHQHQAQSFLLPFPCAEEQDQPAPVPPPPKRLNSGVLIPNARQQGMIVSRQQVNHQQQLQLLPHYPPHHLPKTKVGDELQQQEAIMDHLYKAAELLQTGNPTLAQGILARLNHQLSPVGKPFHRAALYCKEALQLLLHSPTTTIPAADSSPLNLAFKIGAYKSFSEVSPIIDFINFTCNQALLEVLAGFDRIHIVDFDIGYGGQWASLMQELALSSGFAPVLRITAMVSPTTHNQLELCLTRENLIQFANEINIEFDLEFMSIDSLRSGSWFLPGHSAEAVAVNLPVGCLTNYQLPAPLVVGFIKKLSPRGVVTVERGCDRAELPFPKHMIEAVQWYARVLESLEGAHGNVEAIERLVVRPGMEKAVVRRFGGPEKWEEWRSVFVSSGMWPVAMSSWTESQAEWVVRRSGMGGFEVERRPSSLVLCWRRREVLSASVWRCST